MPVSDANLETLTCILAAVLLVEVAAICAVVYKMANRYSGNRKPTHWR